jgi:tetrahydromethanopterin S-methyltransferase subunit G
MAVRVQQEPQGDRMSDSERLMEILRSMQADIREIKERLERIDKPINSGTDS